MQFYVLHEIGDRAFTCMIKCDQFSNTNSMALANLPK